MANPVFIQNSRIGSAIFQVSDSQVVVTTRDNDRNSESRVDLRTLNSRYRVQSRTFSYVVFKAVSAAVIAGSIGWFIARIDWMPEGARFYLAYLPFLFAASYLILAIRFTPKFDFVFFNDHWGRAALCIVRERAQSAECMAFVDSLVARIEIAQSDLDADSRAEVLTSLKSETPAITKTQFAARKWKLAIVLGALAAMLPIVPGANESLGGFMFMLVFPLTVGAALLALLSLSSREPGRWFSLVALALAAIPVVFY